MTNRLTIWMPVSGNDPWIWTTNSTSGTAGSISEKSSLAEQGFKETVVIVPGQWAKTYAHDLPKMRSKERLSAAAFSVEDKTAAALKDEHIVLGTNNDDRLAIIAVSSMERMLAELTEAGLNPDSVYIDFDILSGTLDAIRLTDRIIVPGPDGHTLDPEWDDGEFRDVIVSEPSDLTAFINADAAINLRQGKFARRRQFQFGGNGLARAAAVLAVLGLSWGAYEGTKARALNAQATQYKTEANQLYTKATGKPAPANVALAVTRAAKGQPNSGADVLSLSSQLFAAIATTEGVMIDVLQYDQDKGELNLRLIYPSFESAGQLERAASASGGVFEAGGVREQGGDLIGDAIFRLGGSG